MKQEQDKLENQLWEEREAIRKSHEEKVKVAKTKCATLSSSAIALPTLLQGKDDRCRPVEARCRGI
jgi:hypothetical protein